MAINPTGKSKKEAHHYRKDTAGFHMTKAVPVIEQTATIGEAEQLISRSAGDFETLGYIYVLDREKKLTGVLSIRELFRQVKTAPVASVMTRQVATVRASTDQEHTALLALKHGIKAVPVVRKDGRFLGVVTSDVIISILHDEIIEDTMHEAGAQKLDNPLTNLVHGSAGLHFRKRVGWLLFGLLGGLAAAYIVDLFESAIAAQLVLAAFIPTIVYMADAAGSQTQTIFIRALALEGMLDLRRYARREFITNAMLAAVLGLTAGLAAKLWFAAGLVALVIGLSIFITVLVSMVIAILMPYLFSRFGFDPAVASGPFATVLRDILSLLVYFGIIMLVL